MAKAKVKKEEEIEIDAEETAPMELPAPAAQPAAPKADSDVKRPKLHGHTEKQKPAFDQPADNNMSRTIEE